MGCSGSKTKDDEKIKKTTENNMNEVDTQNLNEINKNIENSKRIETNIKNKKNENIEKHKEDERIKSQEEERKRKEEEEDRKRKEKEEEERKRKEKEEEERKRKEEERIKREEEIKRKEEEEKKWKKIESKDELEYERLKQEELSKTLETEIKSPSKNCIFLGIYGSFLTEKEKALNRLNEIKEDAYRERVKDPETNKPLNPKDYKPLKWSTELEKITRLRAMESIITMGHSRLNEGTIFFRYDNYKSFAENLAWNWQESNSIDMINQWYEEKDDWVYGGNGVTGHYESIISSRFSYVGLGWFNSKIGKYPNCLCGQFSDQDTNNNNFIDSCHDIIQTVEVNKKYISSFCLKGKKNMKVGDTQILEPIVNLTYDNISLSPINKYKLKFSSSDNNVLRVNKFGKVYGNKLGNAIITCKNEDDSEFANITINIKCNHNLDIIEFKESTCTQKGKKTIECKECNSKLEEILPMTYHNYEKIIDKKTKKSKCVCKNCKKTVNCNPPDDFEFYWRNELDSGNNYWSNVPSKNPIGSFIIAWLHKCNGDKKYQDFIFQANNDFLEIPNKSDTFNKFKVVGEGEVNLVVFPKYNPSCKQEFNITLG